MMPASLLKVSVALVAFGLSALGTAAAQSPDTTTAAFTISPLAAQEPAGADLESSAPAQHAGWFRVARARILTLDLSSDTRKLALRDSPQAPRGLVLPVLYGTLAGLQAYDGWSTVHATTHGASEANPFMAGVAGNSGAVWAVKVGSTMASIYVAEGLWRRHHRVEAIVMMVAVNGVMAAVTALNSSVIRGL